MHTTIDKKTVLERYLLTNPGWSEGYRTYNRLLGRPLGWLYVIQEAKDKLIRLDQKGHCSFFSASQANQAGCVGFLTKYFHQLKEDTDKQDTLPYPYKCAYGRAGLVFSIRYLNQLKGFLVLCATSKSKRDVEPLLPLFEQFLNAQVELAYKTFELQNFYETVHPRALALSTMHSVHRVISSSLHMRELLPRIGRLCAQILRAQECGIFLIDEDKKHLVPMFSLEKGKTGIRKLRVKIGRGVEGRVAQTAVFYFSPHRISVPFIEEDIIGVISLQNKIDPGGFTKTDLEILKTLSEQAVVAIKNARLFEEAEQLTVNSIEAINELMELSYSGENLERPLLSELVFEIGKEMRLSGMELTKLHRATFLIDTGHVGTPEHILTKKSHLTKREIAEIRKHPHAGVSVLKRMGSLKGVIPIVLHHHERFDGTGYPKKLKGEEIPIGARVMSVVDAFVAMLAKRPYRSAKTVQEAIEEVKRHSGSQFDPVVVDAFLRVAARPDVLKKTQRFAAASRRL